MTATWPESITLPVNRGYVVTAEAPTMCIHGVQLMPPGHGKPCPHCWGLVTAEINRRASTCDCRCHISSGTSDGICPHCHHSMREPK